MKINGRLMELHAFYRSGKEFRQNLSALLLQRLLEIGKSSPSGRPSHSAPLPAFSWQLALGSDQRGGSHRRKDAPQHALSLLGRGHRACGAGISNNGARASVIMGRGHR